MTGKNKKILIVVAVLIALIIANVIGGVIGFGKGYEAGLYQEGLDSISTVGILNALRNNRIDSATHLLEGKLDWQIYYIATYEKAHYNPYNLYNWEKISKDVDVRKLQTSIMEQVVAYRKGHPCEIRYDFDKDWCSPENEIRKTINNTLKKYEGQNKSK